MGSIVRIYNRAVNLVRERPWLILLPVLAELAQHVAEVWVGMYEGGMDARGESIRLGFGVVKVATLFCTILLAWRLWRFGGDIGRAIRPSVRLLKGIGAFIAIQLLGDLAALGAGRGLLSLVDEPTCTVRIILTVGPLLVWLLASAALFPWYVGLATQDRMMTFRRSIATSKRRMPTIWGQFVVGYIPLMAVHYGLGYAALYGGHIWPLMLIDAVVVGCLAAVIAATYYEIYRQAQEHDRLAAVGSWPAERP